MLYDIQKNGGVEKIGEFIAQVKGQEFQRASDGLWSPR